MSPIFQQWAEDYGLPPGALLDLQQRLAPPAPVAPAAPASSEAAVLNAVRLEAGRRGWRTFRNNCGAMQDKTGRVVRYGLANESKQMSAAIKSGDLILPVPMVVEQHHVGSSVALFGSVEVKRIGGHIDPAQERWRDFILSVGGYACIVSDPSELPAP